MEHKASVSYEDNNWHKKKNVAWIVSICQTRGGRQQYATELSKHIDLSIYGKCGNNTCPDGQNCRKYLQEHYKFYLSFENSVSRGDLWWYPVRPPVPSETGTKMCPRI